MRVPSGAAPLRMHFADRLDERVTRIGNPCVVGIDPHPDHLPEEYAIVRDANAPRTRRARAMGDFACEVIRLVAGRVPAVKPQSAFFELFGADGAAEWERVVTAAHEAGLFVIGDVKRGDIDSTARAYAQAFLEGEDEGRDPRSCDAVTVNPYLGEDSLRPFIDACQRSGKGVFVLVRTSNKGGALFQDHGRPPLYEKVADAVVEWGRALVGESGYSSIGAVVGATHPEELAALRARMPHTPFLLPGYGAQGAGATDVVGGFTRGIHGALVNSSRGILFAYKEARYAGTPWRDATSDALDRMVAAIGTALEAAAR